MGIIEIQSHGYQLQQLPTKYHNHTPNSNFSKISEFLNVFNSKTHITELMKCLQFGTID